MVDARREKAVWRGSLIAGQLRCLAEFETSWLLASDLKFAGAWTKPVGREAGGENEKEVSRCSR
jgi:hypothetical protein